MSKTALVTGFTGQDGTFLTELLLSKGYKVVGLVRRVSTEPPQRVRGRFDFREALDSGQLVLEMGDLLSVDSLINIVNKHRPDEVYNLAAQSDVHVSFMQPEFTIQATFVGVVNLITALEAVENIADKEHGYGFVNGMQVGGKPYKWRLYQASTSEMFGDQKEEMDENTTFMPNSPYSISKAAAHYYCRYKRTQGKFVACGILFNHESEIRGGNFVTQKICREVVRWETDYQELRDEPVKPIQLGNLDSVRDWGYAGDYVKAMWLMLQQNTPDDFVVGTGKTHTVREFVEAAFRGYVVKKNKKHGIDPGEIEWIGKGKDEKGYIKGDLFVEVSDEYWRPVDVRFLKGDSTKARETLGWQPEVPFEELVARMVKNAAEVRSGQAEEE